MSPLLLVMAVLLTQPANDPPQDSISTIEKKLAEREARRPKLEKKIREAVDRGDDETAKALNQEFKENEREIEALMKRQEELKAAREPQWTDNIKVSAQMMLTGWDPALGLGDGFGWGAKGTLGKALYFEYQRWETQSNVVPAHVTVQSWELGLEHEFGRSVEGALTFSMGGGIGLMRFSSNSMPNDTGLVLSLRPEWKYYFNARASAGLGGDFDFLWTSFNNGSTQGRTASSFIFSIDLAF